jgi:Anti-sigma-K factor rskA
VTVSHTDPEILALTALGEQAGTAQDTAHLAQCADCRLELERLTRVVDVGRGDGPVSLEQPPGRVWEQIAATVGSDGARQADESLNAAAPPARARSAANGTSGNAVIGSFGVDSSAGVRTEAPPARLRERRRKLGVAAAGLAAGLIIGIGGTAAVTELTKPAATQVVAEIQLSPLPQFPQWTGAAGTAVLRQAQAAQQLTVAVSAPRRSGFYEVWLLGRDGTSMISLGDLNADDAGTFTLPAGVDLRFYSRIDVSLQPFNGSTQHSATSVVRGSLPAAATRPS